MSCGPLCKPQVLFKAGRRRPPLLRAWGVTNDLKGPKSITRLASHGVIDDDFKQLEARSTATPHRFERSSSLGLFLIVEWRHLLATAYTEHLHPCLSQISESVNYLATGTRPGNTAAPLRCLQRFVVSITSEQPWRRKHHFLSKPSLTSHSLGFHGSPQTRKPRRSGSSKPSYKAWPRSYARPLLSYFPSKSIILFLNPGNGMAFNQAG